MNNDEVVVAKHPGGRPTDYREEYCEEVIEFMSHGYSIEAFAGKLGVSKQTLFNWMDKFPQFMDSVKEGVAKSCLFWEAMGIKGSAGQLKGFNPLSWKFNMQNRFKWTDRQDMTSGDEKIEPVIIYKPEKLPEGSE